MQHYWFPLRIQTASTAMNTFSNHSSTNSSNNFTVPEGCLVLQFEDFIPWDNPDNIMDQETEARFYWLRTGVLLPLLFLIGAPANCLNMAVFCKQGLKERVNLCLFALSLADELYLIQAMLLYGESMYLQFTTGERYGPLGRFMANHFIGFFGFTWASQVMSAVIASERCFCIVSPLHSQTVLKTKTTAIFIATSFFVIVGVYFVVATRYNVVCVFDPVTLSASNAVGGSQFYYEHQELVDYLDSVVYGVIIPGTVVVIVIATTVVTAVKLRQVVAQRAVMSSSRTATVSPLEVALTRMLIGNSILFITCVLPISLFRLALLFVPDLNAGGRYHNTFLSILWLLEVISYINSSFNFFIYYTMGSRYRETLRGLLCRRKATLMNDTPT